ncbi:WD40-repeat-containing domain protein [Mycena crocata]|nr:WD40-repeat-containing domain protein [Mycena crocata]
MYRQQGILHGHRGSIWSMVATDDGKFLASGGKDGTRIWDLVHMTEISHRPTDSGRRGTTVAIVWTSRDDDPGETLFYGTTGGYLVGWRQTPGNQGFREVCARGLESKTEITGLAFDAVSNRLGVCIGSGSVHVYGLSTATQPQVMYSLKVANFFPKAIQFGATRGNVRDILVFGLHDGKIRTFTGAQETDGEAWELGLLIGDAIVDSRRGTVCIDDLESGAILYRLDDHQRVKTFRIPVGEDLRPRQVRFVDDCRHIVIGSDHGAVYIFDRRTGDPIDKLIMHGKDWVQCIATTDSSGVPTIFSAGEARDKKPNEIIMWRKTAEYRFVSSWSETLTIVVQASMLLLSLTFVYQNSEILEEMVKGKLASLYA